MSISQGDKDDEKSTNRWFVGTELLRRGWTKHDNIEYMVTVRESASTVSLGAVRHATILGIHDNGDFEWYLRDPKIVIKDIENGFESHALRQIRVLLPPSDKPNKFEVGDVIDCRDQRGLWRAAEVKAVKPAFEAGATNNENEGILVHFKELGAEHDEWIYLYQGPLGDTLCECKDLCVRKYHRVCREVHYQSQSLHQKWSELSSIESAVPVHNALCFGQSIWISSDKGTMFEFDCRHDTLQRQITNRGFHSPSMCRAGDSSIIMADSAEIRSFNVDSDGSVRAIEPAYPLLGGPLRDNRKFRIDNRCPSLLKIGDHIHIRRGTVRTMYEEVRYRDLVIPLKDILSPLSTSIGPPPPPNASASSPFSDDPITWIQPIDQEAQMDGQTQIVMEDDESGTRLFKFGGVDRENKASNKFYIGALQDDKWIRHNIYEPLEDAFNALARNSGTEHDYNLWIINIIINYFYIDQFAIAWHEAPHWTLKRPLSFCGVIQTDSVIIVLGGEDSNELSDEIYILDTRSNEGWIQSPIKCPTKSRYVAVLDHRQRVHIFTSQSPRLHVDPEDKLRVSSANRDDVYIKGHYCIDLKHLLPEPDNDM